MKIISVLATSLRLIACAMLFAVDLGGQTDTGLDLGIKPFGSYMAGDIDSVSLNQANLFVRISLASIPQRGGVLTWDRTAQSNTTRFQAYGHTDPHTGQTVYQWAPQSGDTQGFRIIDPQIVLCTSTTGYNKDGTKKTWGQAQTADGATHLMGDTSNGFEAIDASGFHFDGSAACVDRGGLRYGPSANLITLKEDTNGNYLSQNSSAQWTDTLGRVFNPETSTSDTTGCVGRWPITSATVVSFPSGLSFKMCYAATPFQTAFGRGATDITGKTANMMQSIVLPNGAGTWIFDYNDYDPTNTPCTTVTPATGCVNYDSLTKITFPTRGTLTYTYTTICSSSTACHRGVISRTLNANDGAGDHKWSYTLGSQTGASLTTVTDPTGNDTVHTFTPLVGSSYYETQTDFYQGTGSSRTLVKTVKTDYSFLTSPYDMCTLSGTNLLCPPTKPAVNVVPIRTTEIWANGKQRKVEKDYDQGFTFYSNTYSGTYGDVVAEREYDYGNGAPGPLLRQTKTADMALSGPNSSSYRANNLVDLPYTVQVLDGQGSQTAYSFYGYDETSPTSSGITMQLDSAPPSGTFRGNQTSAHGLLNGSTVPTTNCNVSVSNGYLVSNKVYYNTGEVQKSSDPCGYPTTYQYSSTYYGAYLTTVTNALNQNTNFAYDFNTGAVTSITDLNSQTTNKTYDILTRLTQVSYPDGGSTNYCYTDMGGANCTQSGPPYAVVMTKPITSSPVLNETSTVVFDGVGRASQTQLNSDTPSTTYTPTTYDGLGRKSRVYNPTRCNPPTTNCGEITWGYSTTNYDPLSRVTTVSEQDGSTVSTDYSAFPCTTVTDETGKSRKSCVDGLGRVTGVWEDPSGVNYETDYVYDALNNLLNVNQKGTAPTDSTKWRTRTFTYNSLSQLLTANNPESGTITYTYDVNSNLASKVAPQPNQTGTATVTTNYSYDELNRLIKKNYVGISTPTAQYGFDAVALTGCTTTPPALTDSYPKGLRTAMCDGSGATSWKHDQMGRILTESRTIVGTSAWTKSAGYTYNLNGSIATISNPGVGRVMTYATTGAGRQASVINTGGSINFVTSATYAPPGELATYTNGASINTTNAYNNRLQPVTLSAATTGTGSHTILSLSYDFHASTHADNGNVFQIVNGRDGNRTQNFLYDSLNRIQQAYTNGPNWGETFGPTTTSPGVPPSTPGIDAWGNLTNRSGVTGKTFYEGLDAAPASTKNQLNGYCHDAAGNLGLYAPCPVPPNPYNPAYTYDAENRLTSTAGWIYVYDGDGRRVKKVNGSSGTLYWPDLSGNVLNESSMGANNLHEYVYLAGKRVARIDVPTPLTVKYYFSDHLGSASVITDASGNTLEESDYYPYGGEIVMTNGDSNNYKFTGKERDSESGLDNFIKRYHASSMGRFMTPDPIMIIKQKLRDPQQWNMYAYTRNNPVRFLDPMGMYNTDCKGSDITKCSANIQNFEANRQQDLQSKDPAVRAAAAAFGSFNDKNKVDLKFDTNATVGKTQQEVKNGKATDRVAATMPTMGNGVNARAAGIVAHEGTHIQDVQSSIAGHPVRQFQSEMKAFMAQAGVLQDFIPLGVPSFASGVDNGISITLMSPFDDTARDVDKEAIRDFLAADPRYGLTENNQGGPVGVQPQ